MQGSNFEKITNSKPKRKWEGTKAKEAKGQNRKRNKRRQEKRINEEVE